MSWVAVGITAGVWVGDKVVSGIGAAQNADDLKEAAEAAEGIYQDKLDLAGKEAGLAVTAAGAAANKNIASISEGAEKAMSKSGLVTAGDVNIKKELTTDSVLAGYQDQLESIGLSTEKSKLQADQERQSLLADIESQPSGFWEGMWS